MAWKVESIFCSWDFKECHSIVIKKIVIIIFFMVACVKGNNRTNEHIMASRNAYYNLMWHLCIKGGWLFVLFVWHI